MILQRILEASAVYTRGSLWILELPEWKIEERLMAKLRLVLKASGGTWGKRAGVYTFPSDPRHVLGLDQTALKFPESRSTHQTQENNDDR